MLLQAPLCYGPAAHGSPFASRRLSAVDHLWAKAEGFKVGGWFIYINFIFIFYYSTIFYVAILQSSSAETRSPDPSTNYYDG
ncbi:MAG: hypothetical protein ABIP30_13865 [Ferruginibacter sp.]